MNQFRLIQHQFPNQRLRLALLMLFVCWMGLLQAALQHNVTHSVITDSHCSLCLSSSSIDHTLPTVSLNIAAVTPVNFVPPHLAHHFHSIAPCARGNRDPPDYA